MIVTVVIHIAEFDRPLGPDRVESGIKRPNGPDSYGPLRANRPATVHGLDGSNWSEHIFALRARGETHSYVF